MSFDWEIDSRRWPLTIIRASGVPSSDDFEAFLQAIHGELAENTGRTAVVVDIRGLRALTIRNRKALADFRRAAKALQRERAIAFAYLIENAVMRVIFNATLWMARPPAPLALFVSMEEARPFLEKYLVREGLHWPEEIPEANIRMG